MPALPADFSVYPVDEIDPHTLGEEPTMLDAPPREEWPSYQPGAERWDIENAPPARMENETYRLWLGRLYQGARYWAQEDTRNGVGSETEVRRGRKRVHEAYPGESEEERTKRVNREAQARWRKNNVPGLKSLNKMSVRQLDLYKELVSAREQLVELQARCQWLKEELAKPA